METGTGEEGLVELNPLCWIDVAILCLFHCFPLTFVLLYLNSPLDSYPPSLKIHVKCSLVSFSVVADSAFLPSSESADRNVEWTLIGENDYSIAI